METKIESYIFQLRDRITRILFRILLVSSRLASCLVFIQKYEFSVLREDRGLIIFFPSIRVVSRHIT